MSPPKPISWPVRRSSAVMAEREDPGECAEELIDLALRGGGTDNINKTVTFDLSSEPLNGTWKLRVNDNAGGDVGYINSWSVTF